MKIIGILLAVVLIAGCNKQMTPEEIRKEVDLCEANGLRVGWVETITGSVVKITCRPFTRTELTEQTQ